MSSPIARPDEGSEPVSTARQRWSWYLYDFADALLIFNGVLYFPKWIVIESGAGELAYNVAFSITTVLLLVTAPITGHLSDVKYGRLWCLRVIRYAVGGSALAIYLSGVVLPPGTARTLVALTAFSILMYGHQASSAFYNALLPRVVGSGGSYLDVAGNGFAIRRAGAVIGILALLPFGRGKIRLIEHGPPEPFLLAAIIYVVLTAVALRFMPDDPPQPDANDHVTLSTILRSLWRDVGRIRHDRRLLLFLIAYATFMDAILTVEGNVTLYMERIMRLGENTQAFLLLLLLAMSAIGARLSAPFATRYGLKTAFTVVLAGWIVILAGISAAREAVLFGTLFALAGVLYGAVSNCARVTYLLLIPSDRRAEYLGLYGSFERCASVTGPLAWGATVSLLGVGIGYRVALLVMAALIAISLPLVRAVDLRPPERERVAEPSVA